MNVPKIAIIHDWLTDMGGAERTVLMIADAFPDAPIYTSVYDPEPLLKRLTAGRDIRTTWLQKLPRGLRKLQRLFPVLRVWAFRSLDLSEFDIIISSSSAESKQVRKTRPGQVHICYCHTPIRYYWSHYKEYKRDPGLGKLNWLAKLAMPVLVPPLRRADYTAAQAVDVFIANSTEVQKRVKKYYGRPSTVIYPPVDTTRFTDVSLPLEQRRGYLAHGRQVPYKRVDLAIAACNELGVPLTVSGNGPEHENLKAMAGPTITFRTGLSDEAVAALFGSVKGYIFAAEEDFGTVQVEALAAGTPVLAYASGGSQDIVRDGEGGITFDNQTVDDLTQAITKLEKHPFKPANLQRIAKRFHKTLFISKIRKVVGDQTKVS